LLKFLRAIDFRSLALDALAPAMGEEKLEALLRR
jgi:hypothetical protein